MLCRSSLLELISQCNSPAMELTTCASGLGSAMATNTAQLQELDVKNLQLLCNELLTSSTAHGDIVTSHLSMATTPQRALHASTCLPSHLFFGDATKLADELRVAIARAANQGEDYVIELSNQICMCLQVREKMFKVYF